MNDTRIFITGLPAAMESKVKPLSSKTDSERLEVGSSDNIQVFTLRRPFNLPELKEAKFEGRDLL